MVGVSSAILLVIAIADRQRRRVDGLTHGDPDPRPRLRGDPRRCRAVHQRHRVVRAQARPGRGRGRIRPGGRRDGAARDDDPDHRHPVLDRRVVERGRRRRDPGRAVHARHAGHVRDRRRRPRSWLASARPATSCASTPCVLAHDMRFFAIAYAIAIGAAFLPVDPVWLKLVVAAVLIGIYVWYVKGHFEADPDTDAEDLVPLRLRRLDRQSPSGRSRPCPGCAWSTCRSCSRCC